MILLNKDRYHQYLVRQIATIYDSRSILGAAQASWPASSKPASGGTGGGSVVGENKERQFKRAAAMPANKQ